MKTCHLCTDPHGDSAIESLPPPFLLDLLLSNAVRMHRALREAGVDADLCLMEAAARSEFGLNSPEEAARDREVRRFCEKRWPAN